MFKCYVKVEGRYKRCLLPANFLDSYHFLLTHDD